MYSFRLYNHDLPAYSFMQAIMFHYGRGGHELEMTDVDLETQGKPSTIGTGGGTDHIMSAGSAFGTKRCDEGLFARDVPFWKVKRRWDDETLHPDR